ncbi:bacterial proteasome activator family protein [Pseudactinotalea terrae]|uniref:bacterial proteasome activator family protein n=1 Tax=Pseudactinotalea terrae TaxID=1743262 RepID=UPI0012E28E94|nr:bacterial proteasome activator family protein [Pseudactinotalea terrae]
MTEPSNETTQPEPNEPGTEASIEQPEGEEQGERVVVASSERIGIHDSKDDPTAAVEEPAKVMRLGMMIKQLLEEVRSAPLDDAARERMAEVHERSLSELESGLSPELVAELHRITLPFADDGTPPSDAELRIAQAQLVGWLEGLFHGIQTALVAQQMAAQNQLVEMRRALPPGVSLPGQPGPGQQNPQQSQPGTGHYL